MQLTRVVLVGIAVLSTLATLNILMSRQRLKECERNETLPTLVDLKNQILFLHIGKAGGGTIYTGRIPLWRLEVSRCHHVGCPAIRNGRFGVELPSSRERAQNTTTFLINLRDPVDRFVSAFYWNLAIACDPRGDNRTRQHSGNNNNVSGICVEKPKRGFNVTYTKYRQDINLLASSLCSSNTTIRDDAVRDLRSINHVTHDLSQWIAFYYKLTNKSADDIYPIVMEKSIPDIESQTDAAMEWLQQKLLFETSKDFARRKQYMQKESSCREMKWKGTSTIFPPIHRHSSGDRKRRLTPKNKACLARYYKNDYVTLLHVKERMCKSEDCRKGIQAILRERERER